MTYSALDLPTSSTSEIDQGGKAGGGRAAGGGAVSAGAGGKGGDSAGGSDQKGGGGATAASGSAGKAGDSGSGGGSASMKPLGLTLANKIAEVVLEPGPGGTPFVNRCPAGAVVIGFYGTVDDPADPEAKTYLRSAQALCAELTVSPSEPYTITVTPAGALAMHQIAAAKVQMAVCPADQVMTGFAGQSGLWMDSVDVRCAPLSISGVAPNFALVVGTPTKAGTIGGPSGGSPFDPLQCAPGDLAVGQIIRTINAGTLLGAFGVECATASIKVGPG